MSKEKLMLLLSDARGTYIPRDFVTGFKIMVKEPIPESGMLDDVTNLFPFEENMQAWQGIDLDDVLTCIDPDSEWYWDAWQSILDNAFWIDEDGTKYTLYQSGDLWATAYDIMTEKEKAEFFEGYEPEQEPEQFSYYINLDERGEFYADVRNAEDDTVFEIHGFDIFEDGYMSDKNDLSGLQEYLVSLEIMPEDAELTKGN
jgi:hypothetical protein